MGDQLFTSLVSIATAIVGVAILAVLVSRNSNTAGVLSAAGSAFAQDLSIAVSPITGGGIAGGNFSNNNFSPSFGF